MNRPLFAAAVAVLLGIGGLLGSTLPQHSAGPAASSVATGIVVGGAYVRQPASAGTAAAYFTVYNNTSQPDVLTGISTGAGQDAMLHTDTDGTMVMAMSLTIGAHSSVALTPGKEHVMIEKLYGKLLPGQTVNLELTFATAGTIVVTAPVIAVLAPAPGSTPG